MMRMLIFELRPPILAEQGLAAALGASLEAVEGRAGLKTELRVTAQGRLPPQVEKGLYRIAAEALNNALRDAQAHRISVSPSFEPEVTSLEVADDGVGVDPSSVPQRAAWGCRAWSSAPSSWEGH